MNYIKELIKKNKTFLKYILVAILSFLIDITFFTIFNFLFTNIILATILARIISSLINFLLNRDKVFKSLNKNKIMYVKYYTLVICQMLVSAFVVDNLVKIIPINATLIKIPVEFIIFICNYLIQKFFIFK